jgi:hypothetical protein
VGCLKAPLDLVEHRAHRSTREDLIEPSLEGTSLAIDVFFWILHA